jgi:hypothetical protein
MAAPIGICPLCRERKTLCKSHLMSAAPYPLCQGEEGDHVSVTAEVMMPTQRQTQDYLLCSKCEESLNKNGERYVLPLLSRLGGSFLLYERVKRQQPILSNQSLTVYAAATNPEIEVSRLIHFGIGIFWKASVHSFGSGSESPRIDLGNDREALRLYLRGESELPNHMALAVAVESGPIRYTAMIDPLPGQNPNFRSVFFYVPGMQMQLYIGDGVREASGKYSINANPQYPILMVPLAKDMRDVFRKHGSGAYRTEKLKKRAAEIEARGLDIKLGY